MPSKEIPTHGEPTANAQGSREAFGAEEAGALIRQGADRAGVVLNKMLPGRPDLSVSIHDVEALDECNEPRAARRLAVQVTFRGALRGHACLAFEPSNAGSLVRMLAGEDDGARGLDAMRRRTLAELGSVVLSGLLSALAARVPDRLDYSLPVVRDTTLSCLVGERDEATRVLGRARFKLENQTVDGVIILVLEPESEEAQCESRAEPRWKM